MWYKIPLSAASSRGHDQRLYIEIMTAIQIYFMMQAITDYRQTCLDNTGYTDTVTFIKNNSRITWLEILQESEYYMVDVKEVSKKYCRATDAIIKFRWRSVECFNK